MILYFQGYHIYSFSINESYKKQNQKARFGLLTNLDPWALTGSLGTLEFLEFLGTHYKTPLE